MSKLNFFWFRRDLRLHNNTALFNALKSGLPVQCVFIFDRNILDKLESDTDARVNFIHRELVNISHKLKEYGSSLIICFDKPENAWRELITRFPVHAIYCNRDYEPYALQRDKRIKALASEKNIAFNTFKDHVLIEPGDVLKSDGSPYTVYTPYRNACTKFFSKNLLASSGSEHLLDNLNKTTFEPVMALGSMGFKHNPVQYPDRKIDEDIIAGYRGHRDFPGKQGTSKLSLHLRFGTISIRDVAKKAQKHKSDVFMNELQWRDFYQMILFHFPQVETKAFKPMYDMIPWRNDENEFERWCNGETGYPIVDAGMRELNQTGFMHNRVRMITASFLVKHLLIDWRWGEAYFAKKLLDYELASNNGGWQWAAGSGCDAAPYFRIFSPDAQTKKFDPEYVYIKKWVPEYDGNQYPAPLVDHKIARERCLRVYKKALRRE